VTLRKSACATTAPVTLVAPPATLENIPPLDGSEWAEPSRAR
jgi:hypothetical protein